MKVIVLGSAAGGGFPQWNCNTELCQKARYAQQGQRVATPSHDQNQAHDQNQEPSNSQVSTNHEAIAARTQSSIAVSANNEDFLLCNASPDLRQQINQTPDLYPIKKLRDSPIRSVILTNGDVDHIAGLLTMREKHAFNLYATQRVLDVIQENSIFNVIDESLVNRIPISLGENINIHSADGIPLGIEVIPFSVPGKIALYLEDHNQANYGSQIGDTIGLQIIDRSTGHDLYYIPGCADIDAQLLMRCQGANLLLFDGTVFNDDDMITAGVGEKTGHRMGHISMNGAHGSLQMFQTSDIQRKIFIHINNTNPVLDNESQEHDLIHKFGWETAYDGMMINI